MVGTTRKTTECTTKKTGTYKQDVNLIRSRLDQLDIPEGKSDSKTKPAENSTELSDGHGSWQVRYFDSLPAWLQDNEYLLFHHRPHLPSLKACFLSIFRVHTETGNIWTHLLGVIFFLGLAVYSWNNPPGKIPSDIRIMITIFLMCAIFCMSASFAFHTLNCYSETITKFLCKVDYCGIAVLIMGSSLAWMYHSFHGDLKSLVWYTVLVVSMGLAVILCSLWDRFGEPELRSVRAAVFIAFGVSGAIPAVHYMAEKGLEHAIQHASFGLLSLSGALYLLGGAVYAMRIPERFAPGMCDIFFQSHQILHIMVIGGALVFYCAIYKMAAAGQFKDVAQDITLCEVHQSSVP